MLPDWDSLDAFKAFQASETYPPFLEDFKRSTAGKPSLWHVDFKPSVEALHKVCNTFRSEVPTMQAKYPSQAQSAPVTEVVTFYFADSPPTGFIEKALAFREVLAQQPGFVEVALGVTHQEVEFEGQTGHALVVLVGWESEESWKTFADSEEYKEKNPGQSLEAGVLKGFEMEVVSLREFGR